eukprot:2931472-Amphidinium_carterae.1
MSVMKSWKLGYNVGKLSCDREAIPPNHNTIGFHFSLQLQGQQVPATNLVVRVWSEPCDYGEGVTPPGYLVPWHDADVCRCTLRLPQSCTGAAARE